MSKFKVGDRVVIASPTDTTDLLMRKAKIVVIESPFYGLEVNGWSGGHGLRGHLGDSDSGWWVTEQEIKLAKVFRGNTHAY